MDRAAECNEDIPNPIVRRIRDKLRTKSKREETRDRLKEIRMKELQRHADEDGLNKHSTIHWEREDIQSTDFKADEKKFKHDLQSVLEQKAAMNARESMINSTNSNCSQTEIVHNEKVQATDQRHFDAIFSKPTMKNAGKEIEIEKAAHEVKSQNKKNNDGIRDSNPPIRKKKTSWRQRVKKYTLDDK